MTTVETDNDDNCWKKQYRVDMQGIVDNAIVIINLISNSSNEIK